MTERGLPYDVLHSSACKGGTYTVGRQTQPHPACIPLATNGTPERASVSGRGRPGSPSCRHLWTCDTFADVSKGMLLFSAAKNTLLYVSATAQKTHSRGNVFFTTLCRSCGRTKNEEANREGVTDHWCIHLPVHQTPPIVPLPCLTTHFCCSDHSFLISLV